VKPILDVCNGRYGKERIKGFWILTNKHIGINSKNLIPLGMEELHFGAEAAMPGLILCGEIMAVDSFITFLPKAEKGVPDCRYCP
jgi:hypothetical protein